MSKHQREHEAPTQPLVWPQPSFIHNWTPIEREMLPLCWLSDASNITRMRNKCKSNLAKDCIAVLSPLVAANGFVRSWPPSNGSLDPHESAPKWHLDRFSHFSQLTRVTTTQTDRHTYHAMCYNCSDAAWKKMTVMAAWNGDNESNYQLCLDSIQKLSENHRQLTGKTIPARCCQQQWPQQSRELSLSSSLYSQSA